MTMSWQKTFYLEQKACLEPVKIALHGIGLSLLSQEACRQKLVWHCFIFLFKGFSSCCKSGNMGQHSLFPPSQLKLESECLNLSLVSGSMSCVTLGTQLTLLGHCFIICNKQIICVGISRLIVSIKCDNIHHKNILKTTKNHNNIKKSPFKNFSHFESWLDMTLVLLLALTECVHQALYGNYTL